MTKRYFRILPPLKVYELDGTQARDRETDKPIEVSHPEFIRHRTIDPAFVSDTPKTATAHDWNMAAQVSAETVRALVRDKKVDDLVEMDEDDWQRLKRSVEKGAYHQVAGASLLPFMREVCDATLERPKDETKALPEAPTEPPAS